MLVHETEGAHGKFDFASERAAAPDDLRVVLDGACMSHRGLSLFSTDLLWQTTRASPIAGATTSGKLCS